MLRKWIIALIVPTTLLFVYTAHASEKEEAKRHFNNGLNLLKVEDFNGAAAEFELAINLYPTKGGLFNLANCLRALHRYGDALRTFERLEIEFGAKLDKTMRQEVKKQTEEIRNLVAELTIQVNRDGAKIFVDNRQIGRSPLESALIIGPGQHLVSVSLDGYEPQQQQINLVSGARATTSFSLAQSTPITPTPTPADSHSPENTIEKTVNSDSFTSRKIARPLMWSGLAGTVLGGATSAIFWGLTGASNDDYQQHLDAYKDTLAVYDPRNSAQQAELADLHSKMTTSRNDIQRFNNLAVGATIVTGVFIAAGTVGLILELRAKKEAQSVSFNVAPGSFQLRF